VAKSKFDISLLKPVDENNTDFTSQLNPIDDEEDPGAYLDSLPETGGTLDKFKRILTGLTHAGRNLHNAPHDLVAGLENGLQGIGKTFNQLPGSEYMKQGKRLSEYLPNDTNDYQDVYGLKGEGTLMDQLLQKGFEHAPELIGGAGVLRAGFRRLKGTHQLDRMRRLVTESEMGVRLPRELSDQARNFLPNTHATREMLNDAERGNFTSSFSTQSQMGHHQANLAKSPLASERLIAPEVGDLKQTMLNHYENVFRNAGRNDIADMMRSGINNYRRYKQFMNVAIPLAKKLKIPTSGLAVLGLGLYEGKKLLNK
jgi:hypothetical protein